MTASSARAGIDIPQVSWDQVRRFRLARHHLLQPEVLAAMPQVVRDICGVQAQVATSAALALRARIQGLSRDDVERALSGASERGSSLVKTWCMRGTVHLLDAPSLPVYLAAVGDAVIAAERRWMSRDGLSPEWAQAIVDCIGVALRDGPLTRKELSERVRTALGEEAGTWVASSWGGVVKQACLSAMACFGAERSGEVTFSLLRQHLPEFVPADRESAVETLLTRYLRSYGPASAGDFAGWAGLKARDANGAVKRLGEAIVQVHAGDERKGLLMMRDDLAGMTTTATAAIPAASTTYAAGAALSTGAVPTASVPHGPGQPGSVRLLPNFDQFLLAHQDKDWLVDQANYPRVYRKAGWISPVVLVDGRVAGVWSHKMRGRRVKVDVELFDNWTNGPGRPAFTVNNPLLQEEIADVERFLAGPS